MTSSNRPPSELARTVPDDEPPGFGDPFWTDDRRAAFRDVIRRLVVSLLLALLAAIWAVIAFLWLLDLAVSEEPEPSGLVWFAWLLPSIGLLALGVARLVGPRAPAMLRILGVIYAILGTMVILSILEIA